MTRPARRARDAVPAAEVEERAQVCVRDRRNDRIPKSRCVVKDHDIDYEEFSRTIPDSAFPKGANWLMLGPSGPRRLRLAIEHLCQFRGGICFCVDLDPRYVVKLLKKGDVAGAKAYADHVIDQAMTILSANHNIQCAFATPKLLEALALRLIDKAPASKKRDQGRVLRRNRNDLAVDSIRRRRTARRERVHRSNVRKHLMGLACGKPVSAADNWKIAYYAPQPRLWSKWSTSRTTTMWWTMEPRVA